jgi:DNA polymerase-3 subunit gamma/tau
MLETPSSPPERTGASLAVRYRPRCFADVVGQRHVTDVLRRAIATDRLPQQILFSGESGLGKTTLARATAAALLCSTPLDERDNADACGHCDNCMEITTPGRTHPDVIEFDAASHGGKDEIKVIADRAQLSPLLAARKVYIIDEAHGLSGPGGQAFLKLLEEPPAHVTFMLATTDPQKMLKTNRGRCTEFELLSPTTMEMAENLVRVATSEGWDLDDDAALAVVGASDPALGVRATLMSLEKLAGALDEGLHLSGSDVASLLGVMGSDAIAGIVDAICAFDPPRAFDALGLARGGSSDAAVRAALTEWARQEVLASTPATFSLATWRLSTILEAPDSVGWLELVIARLTSPRPAAETLTALTAAAEQAAARLRAELDQVTTVDPSPSSTPAAAFVAEPAPSTTPAVEPGHIATPGAIEDGAFISIDVAASNNRLDPAELLAAFITRAAERAPKAAALLRASELIVEGDSIVIVTKEENARPLRALGDPLRAVAAELGIVLRLAKPN